MIYLFKCTNKDCGAEEEKNIPIADYDREKENQACLNCGAKMDRVIEWTGIAEGGGEGWFGARGGKII